MKKIYFEEFTLHILSVLYLYVFFYTYINWHIQILEIWIKNKIRKEAKYEKDVR